MENSSAPQSDVFGIFRENMERVIGPAGPFASYLKAVNPKSLIEANLQFYKALFEIGIGKSEIEPDGRDWRFKDETWTKNPLYKRLSQAYLAMCEAVEAMIPDDLPLEEKSRAELAASIVTSSLSPTNTLAGNPAALKRTMETRGSNLARGFQAFLKDLQSNDGLPRQVDTSSFEVGKNLAVTPGKIIHRTRMFELIQYAPSTDKVHEVPVMLVPPQIGRYYFTDLAPGRSFAEFAVSQGLQYFTISWRNPSPNERDFGLADYAEAVLEATEVVAEVTGQPKINILGFCAGGILSGMVAGHLASKGDNRLNSLTLCVAMLDFQTDASLGAFRFPAMLSMAKAQSRMKGILPGSELGKIFTWLRPNDLVWNYWVNNYLMGDEPPAFDILAWNADSSNMAAQLHEDFLKLFEDNDLAEPGKYRLLDETVDLAAIECDKFFVGAVTDHLTPWKACYQSGKLFGGSKTFALSNGGHIAALVNPPGNPKAYHNIGPLDEDDADHWLESSERRPGSWWESWTKWCGERSGSMIAAKQELGSKKHKPLMDAPGEYVKQ
uniref:PHA/PHB synthase family protein n=1 Tax=Parerythrobacter lutipelagi TaxID=1964208 RepID=UPI0010F6EB7C|nr:alpha/beta fold hydrolase [Parerythrobacter lutipelagi]